MPNHRWPWTYGLSGLRRHACLPDDTGVCDRAGEALDAPVADGEYIDPGEVTCRSCCRILDGWSRWRLVGECWESPWSPAEREAVARIDHPYGPPRWQLLSPAGEPGHGEAHTSATREMALAQARQLDAALRRWKVS